MYKAGYEYLLAYKITVPIYDYTVIFCKRYRTLLSSARTYDQMVQAARSGTQNIPEGNQQASLESYIKLTGVNHGSLEELLKDFLAFARQNNIEIWEKVRVEREVRELNHVWEIIKKTPTLPNSPNFPDFPDNLTKTVNLKKLQRSLEQKFVKEGGFRENLFKKRLENKFG